MGREQRRHGGQQLALDGEVFDDRFDDPIRLGHGREVVEAAQPDAAGELGREESRRLALHRGPESPLGRAGQVQQMHGEPGVGAMGGNARAHRSRAQHRDRLDGPSHDSPSYHERFSGGLGGGAGAARITRRRRSAADGRGGCRDGPALPSRHRGHQNGHSHGVVERPK